MAGTTGGTGTVSSIANGMKTVRELAPDTYRKKPLGIQTQRAQIAAPKTPKSARGVGTARVKPFNPHGNQSTVPSHLQNTKRN